MDMKKHSTKEPTYCYLTVTFINTYCPYKHSALAPVHGYILCLVTQTSRSVLHGGEGAASYQVL